MLCSNRTEGFGPLSNLYTHILTSCFIDTILIPLCTWLYLLTILILVFLPSSSSRRTGRDYVPGVGFKRQKAHLGAHRNSPTDVEIQEDTLESRAMKTKHSKFQLALNILYYFFLIAQTAMCLLEIARLSLADLGIGLLPFTIVTLLVAGALRFSRGLGGRVAGWRWANVGVFVALAITNGVKLAEEIKEGLDTRKATKYPESDELTDVAVIVGLFVILVFLEVIRRS